MDIDMDLFPGGYAQRQWIVLLLVILAVYNRAYITPPPETNNLALENKPEINPGGNESSSNH